jgi:hypothetical protein
MDRKKSLNDTANSLYSRDATRGASHDIFVMVRKAQLEVMKGCISTSTWILGVPSIVMDEGGLTNVHSTIMWCESWMSCVQVVDPIDWNINITIIIVRNVAEIKSSSGVRSQKGSVDGQPAHVPVSAKAIFANVSHGKGHGE